MGVKIHEAEDVGRSFIRVCAADLYDLAGMVDGKERRFVDDLYRGLMLKAVRDYLHNDNIVPFDNETELEDAYVGNGMFTSEH
jgi:hypothetical protein